MFGLGFSEILMIAVIAILFLGPDKLPSAMVQIAKLFKTVKNSVNEAKSSIEQEINIQELKQNAQEYKKSFEKTKSDVQKKLSLDDFGDFEKTEVDESIRDLEASKKKETEKAKQEAKPKRKKAKKSKKSEEA